MEEELCKCEVFPGKRYVPIGPALYCLTAQNAESTARGQLRRLDVPGGAEIAGSPSARSIDVFA